MQMGVMAMTESQKQKFGKPPEKRAKSAQRTAKLSRNAASRRSIGGIAMG